MAGVKGKSGGPRKNAGGSRPNTGGKRPGAGRKPTPKPVDESKVLQVEDPKAFLIGVMRNPAEDMRMRMDAAKTLMPFVHLKLGEGGKKDQKKDLAKAVAGGKFSASAPPPSNRQRMN